MVSDLSDLAAASALEVILAADQALTVDLGRRHDDRPIIGGFRTHDDAVRAWAQLPDSSTYMIIPDEAYRPVERWWLAPVERFMKPGYFLPGPWNGWASPRWIGGR